MICFFWDLTSLRKSSMKSSAFGWEASLPVESLGASLLADGECCANAEFVATNAVNIRVIAKTFFCLTGSFLTVKLELGASAAHNGQEREPSSMHDSNRALSCIPRLEQFLNCRRGHLRLLHRHSEKINLHGRVWRHVVSSVTCHVTWRVMECSGPPMFSKRRKRFVPVPTKNLRFMLVSVRHREWNCSCSN